MCITESLLCTVETNTTLKIMLWKKIKANKQTENRLTGTHHREFLIGGSGSETKEYAFLISLVVLMLLGQGPHFWEPPLCTDLSSKKAVCSKVVLGKRRNWAMVCGARKSLKNWIRWEAGRLEPGTDSPGDWKDRLKFRTFWLQVKSPAGWGCGQGQR